MKSLDVLASKKKNVLAYFNIHSFRLTPHRPSGYLLFFIGKIPAVQSSSTVNAIMYLNKKTLQSLGQYLTKMPTKKPTKAHYQIAIYLTSFTFDYAFSSISTFSLFLIESFCFLLSKSGYEKRCVFNMTPFKFKLFRSNGRKDNRHLGQ